MEGENTKPEVSNGDVTEQCDKSMTKSESNKNYKDQVHDKYEDLMDNIKKITIEHADILKDIGAESLPDSIRNRKVSNDIETPVTQEEKKDDEVKPDSSDDSDDTKGNTNEQNKEDEKKYPDPVCTKKTCCCCHCCCKVVFVLFFIMLVLFFYFAISVLLSLTKGY